MVEHVGHRTTGISFSTALMIALAQPCPTVGFQDPGRELMWNVSHRMEYDPIPDCLFAIRPPAPKCAIGFAKRHCALQRRSNLLLLSGHRHAESWWRL